MARLGIGDVIWIYDGTIDPPGPKMVACIVPELGFFYRINTKPWRPAVQLAKLDHGFLNHDSYLECGDPLELDDYLVEEALVGKGVIGRLSAAVCREIEATLAKARTYSAADKAAILAALAKVK